MELSNRQMVSTKKIYVIDENLELISIKMVNGAKKLDEIQTLNVSNSFTCLSPLECWLYFRAGAFSSPILSLKNSELVPGMK